LNPFELAGQFMTNQTQLDYLFKLTAAPSERGASGSAGSSGRRPAFDDHLVHASTSAGGSSPNSAGVRDRSNDRSTLGDGGSTTRARADDGYAAASSTPAETAATEPATSDDANQGPVDDPEASGAQSGVEEGAVGHAADSENEDYPDHGEAHDIAAASLTGAHDSLKAAQEQADSSAASAANDAEQRLALASTLASDSDRAERRAGNVSATEHIDALAANDAASNLEVELAANHKKIMQASDSSPSQSIGEQSNASNAHESQARKAADASHAAGDTAAAPLQNATNSSNSGKSRTTGRRSLSEGEKSADDPNRRGTSRASQRADAKAVQDQAAAIVAANVATAQSTNSAATTEAAEDASRVAKSVGQNTDAIHGTARSQRAGVGASRRVHGISTPELPRVDAARFVGRVAKAVQTAQERGGALHLRLSPPELGSLRLELSMQNGAMTATVETETSAARQVLLDHLPALRERLAEQNIRIERFDVDVRQENSGGQADPRASQQEHRQHPQQQPHSRHAAGRSAASQPTTDEAPNIRSRLINSELNLLA
jgi:flagellar hook-length control protein FliK